MIPSRLRRRPLSGFALHSTSPNIPYTPPAKERLMKPISPSTHLIILKCICGHRLIPRNIGVRSWSRGSLEIHEWGVPSRGSQKKERGRKSHVLILRLMKKKRGDCSEITYLFEECDAGHAGEIHSGFRELIIMHFRAFYNANNWMSNVMNE